MTFSSTTHLDQSVETLYGERQDERRIVPTSLPRMRREGRACTDNFCPVQAAIGKSRQR